ncbi:hypothetical protein DmGdi_10210 [Gluconobacter sp. Gdi]|nr:hypothetical protein DmGdi_10210 [Gluconobacter sp. Gdi]
METSVEVSIVESPAEMPGFFITEIRASLSELAFGRCRFWFHLA